MSFATDRRSPGEWLQLVLGAAIVAVMFYPTVWMVLSAFKSNREIFRDPFGLPDTWRWSNFAEAWTRRRAGQALPQLGDRDGGGGDARVLCATAAAFAFSRLEFPGRRWLYRLLLIGLLLPPPVVAIPLFGILRDMGLLNTLWALILPGAAWSLSLTVFIMYGYFNAIRPDMEEAALLEGASTWQIFRDISLPMVWPSMLTMAIVNTINIWNELMFALLFIDGRGQAHPARRADPLLRALQHRLRDGLRGADDHDAADPCALLPAAAPRDRGALGDGDGLGRC